jgi:hypothetical protein
MNQNRLLFIQIQALSPSMHHKWKEILGFCMQHDRWNITGYQLLMRSPIAVKV